MMKKRVMMIIISLCLIMLLGGVTVSAGEPTGKVLTLDTNVSGGIITVFGTVDNNVEACAIMVYDKSGSTLKAMETCGVRGDHKYSHKMTAKLSGGEYIVAVADYDGGETITKNIVIPGAVRAVNTGDDSGIMLLSVIVLMAITGGGVALLTRRKVK